MALKWLSEEFIASFSTFGNFPHYVLFSSLFPSSPEAGMNYPTVHDITRFNTALFIFFPKSERPSCFNSDINPPISGGAF
jgi:hypothetical protein